MLVAKSLIAGAGTAWVGWHLVRATLRGWPHVRGLDRATHAVLVAGGVFGVYLFALVALLGGAWLWGTL